MTLVAPQVDSMLLSVCMFVRDKTRVYMKKKGREKSKGRVGYF